MTTTPRRSEQERERILAEVERIADAWNATPDYAPTEYDHGRVDQRHDMTMQILEALEPRRASPEGEA
jgi:hypothetical protein